MLKQEIARPTTKNWVHWASNQPSSDDFDQLLAIFCTRRTRIVQRAQQRRLRGLPSCLVSKQLPILVHHWQQYHQAYRSNCCTESPNLSRLRCLCHTRSARSQACWRQQRRRSWRAATSFHFLLLDQQQVWARRQAYSSTLRTYTRAHCQATNFHQVWRNQARRRKPRACAPLPQVAALRGSTAIWWDFAVDTHFSLLFCLEHPCIPLPPLLVANKPFSRPCCCVYPMLFRTAPVKPIRQGHQAGRGANQPSCHQHHQNCPRADFCIQLHPPPSNLIAQRFTLHFEAKSSQVIGAVLTFAIYFYLGWVAVALGSTQLAYFHVVIVFATFVPRFFDQKWELLSF